MYYLRYDRGLQAKIGGSMSIETQDLTLERFEGSIVKMKATEGLTMKYRYVVTQDDIDQYPKTRDSFEDCHFEGLCLNNKIFTGCSFPELISNEL